VPLVEVADRQVQVVILFIHRRIRTPELTSRPAGSPFFAPAPDKLGNDSRSRDLPGFMDRFFGD
jgi:hypothetical protein